MRKKRTTKDVDFKPMLITVDKDSEREFNLRKTAFLSILSDFFNEANEFIEIANKNDFKGNYFNEFKSQFEQKYKGQFPEIVTIDKQLELANVNVNKLRFLSDKLNEFNDIQIDLNTGEIDTPDFGIYTENENQNKLLIYCLKLSNIIAEGKQYTTIHNGHILSGFNNLLTYNHDSNNFSVNYYFLTNQIR